MKKLKKSSSEVPADCKSLIKKLEGCGQELFLQELRGIETWTYGKCELYHWIDILDLCDDILEQATSRAPGSWVLFCDQPGEAARHLKELVLWTLHFTLIIEHSFSRHLYSSMEHLSLLLSSFDLDVVLAVLNLLYMVSKRSNFISRLAPDKRQLLLTRLSHLAASLGGKDNGFGLSVCCSDEPISAFPTSASATTLHFEFYAEGRDSGEGKKTGQSSSVTVIHVEGLDRMGKTPAALMEELLEQHQVPEEKQMLLFTYVRLAHGFSDYKTRLKSVEARLQALSVLIYGNQLTDFIQSLLYSGLLKELVDVLEMKGEHLMEIKAVALKSLTSLIHIDRNPNFPELNTIIDVTGAASYHGFLPVMVRNCIGPASTPAIPQPAREPSPQPLASTLFSFLHHLASYEAGGEALVSWGMMESLLKVILQEGKGGAWTDSVETLLACGQAFKTGQVKQCLERTVSVLGLVAGLKGSEDTLSATQDAAVVVRRHLELALSVQAAAVLALLSFDKLTSIIIKVFSVIAILGFCPLKELDEEGAKGDVEFKRSEEETRLGQWEGAKDVFDQINKEDMQDGAYKNPEDRQDKEEKDNKEEDTGIEMSDNFDSNLQEKNEEEEAGEEKDEEDKEGELEDETADVEGEDEKEDKAKLEYSEEQGKAEEENTEELAAKEDKEMSSKEDEKKERKEKEKDDEAQEFDDHQVDPYQGEDQQLPEPEALDLPDAMELDDKEKDNFEEAGEQEPGKMPDFEDDVEDKDEEWDEEREREKTEVDTTEEKAEDEGILEEAVMKDPEEEMEQEVDQKEKQEARAEKEHSGMDVDEEPGLEALENRSDLNHGDEAAKKEVKEVGEKTEGEGEFSRTFEVARGAESLAVRPEFARDREGEEGAGMQQLSHQVWEQLRDPATDNTIPLMFYMVTALVSQKGNSQEFIVLLRAGDIEVNPGPGHKATTKAVEEEDLCPPTPRKNESKREKFTLAYQLEAKMDELADKAMKEMGDPTLSLQERQVAAAVNLLRITAIRAGNRGTTENRGLCTLRRINLELLREFLMRATFMGKSTILYDKEFQVPAELYQWMQGHLAYLLSEDLVFNISPRLINCWLDDILQDLTCRVFRTRLACSIVKDGIEILEVGADPAAVKETWKAAAMQAAVALNHKERPREGPKHLAAILAAKAKLAAAAPDKVQALQARVDKLEKQLLGEVYSSATTVNNYIDPRLPCILANRHGLHVSELVGKKWKGESFTWAIKETQKIKEFSYLCS